MWHKFGQEFYGDGPFICEVHDRHLPCRKCNRPTTKNSKELIEMLNKDDAQRPFFGDRVQFRNGAGELLTYPLDSIADRGASIDGLEKSIQRVRDLHRPVTLGEAGVFCEHCDQDHPCITIKALDGEQ